VSTAAKVLAFLVEHLDLFEVIYEAIESKGADKNAIKEAIKKSITAAYDERAKAELAP
jgi:hypothetical protein